MKKSLQIIVMVVVFGGVVQGTVWAKGPHGHAAHPKVAPKMHSAPAKVAPKMYVAPCQGGSQDVCRAPPRWLPRRIPRTITQWGLARCRPRQ